MISTILDKMDASRRSFIKRLLGTSFAAPVIATFSIEALTSSTAQAQFQNQTCDAASDEIFRSGFWDGAAGGSCTELQGPIGPLGGAEKK